MTRICADYVGNRSRISQEQLQNILGLELYKVFALLATLRVAEIAVDIAPLASLVAVEPLAELVAEPTTTTEEVDMAMSTTDGVLGADSTWVGVGTGDTTGDSTGDTTGDSTGATTGDGQDPDVSGPIAVELSAVARPELEQDD